MSVFRASPEGIRRFADQIGRASLDAQKAKDYMGEHCNLAEKGDGKLFPFVFDLDKRVRGKVTDFLKDAVTRLDASSDALHDAAHYYRTTDDASAESVDRALRTEADRRVRPGVQE